MANNTLFGNYGTIGNIALCFKLDDAGVIIFPWMKFPFDIIKDKMGDTRSTSRTLYALHLTSGIYDYLVFFPTLLYALKT